MTYTKWFEVLLAGLCLTWAVLATFLGPIVPDLVLAFSGLGVIFWLPLLWLAYGCGAPFKRGAAFTAIISACCAALWLAWRLLPGGVYENAGEDAIVTIVALAWIVFFLIGAGLRGFHLRKRSS